MGSFVFYLMVMLFCLLMGVVATVVFYEKGLEKSQHLARKISALSPKSQKYINDLVIARTVRDDQKYSKTKKG